MKLKLLSIPLLMTVSCGDKQTSELQSEVGAGVLRPFTDADPDLSSAIGRLDKLCTVFHIGDGIAASAAHCFNDDQTKEAPCISKQIKWQDGSQSQCVQVLDYKLNENEDYVVFEVDPAPAEKLKLAQVDSIENDKITIFGYPNKQALQVSEDCSASLESQKIKHNCPTLPGHSGSPILRPDDLKVIGIHNGNYSQSLNYGSLFPQHQKSWREVREGRGEQRQWGPFKNNSKELLYHVSSKVGKEVSFTLEYDLEDGYDFIFVQDGHQIKHQLSGKDSRRFTLPTPVIISFESDYAGESNKVEISQIEST